jgi:hypothetical protein|tara:strand:+ start:311 stop:1012 length:702 start_codon:yes stop_codon:yes gene_type:complete
MANTTTTSLKLTVQATGDNSGTWGQITNTNLQILEQAIGGYDAVGITSGATLSFTNGTLSNGKNQVLKLTGTITGNVNVVIPDSVEKTYIVENATTGAHTVTFKTNSGSGITFSSTDKGKKILYSDGTNVLEGVTSVGNLTTGTIAAIGAVTVTGHILPGANDTYDLGASNNVFRDIYTGDLHLTNRFKEKGNVVDGTKGHWTLQEGENDIFMINNISGEKFKINLSKIKGDS